LSEEVFSCVLHDLMWTLDVELHFDIGWTAKNLRFYNVQFPKIERHWVYHEDTSAVYRVRKELKLNLFCWSFWRDKRLSVKIWSKFRCIMLDVKQSNREKESFGGNEHYPSKSYQLLWKIICVEKYSNRLPEFSSVNIPAAWRHELLINHRHKSYHNRGFTYHIELPFNDSRMDLQHHEDRSEEIRHYDLVSGHSHRLRCLFGEQL